MINNLERIFTRAKRSKYIGERLTLNDFKFQSVTKTYSLLATASLTGQPVDFPQGAILLSVGIDAGVQGAAGSSARGTLDMIRIAIDLPSQDGTLTAGGAVRASTLVGREGDKQWPEKEVVLPRQGTLNVSLTNLTSSVLDVDVAFHVLIPRGAG